MNVAQTLQDLRRHEGFRAFPYRCSGGKLTIGYGRNLEANGITEQEAEHLLLNDALRSEQDAIKNLDFYHQLDQVRQGVVVNMIYNLGVERFLGFKKMLAAMRASDWHEASREMRDSLWYRQVGQRAEELARRMETGEL